jgi:hypothetical protein
MEKSEKFHRSAYCDVDYLTDMNVVLVKWKKFCRQDEYRAPLRMALEIMQQHPGCQYIADTRDGFENDPLDTEWLLDTFLPQAAKTSCRMVFFIIASDNRLKDELEGQSIELGKLFAVHYCFDLDEVREILSQ